MSGREDLRAKLKAGWTLRDVVLGHHEDAEDDAPFRSRKDGGGWVRIGRYDGSRRRAVWSRLLPLDGDTPYTAIEICAGREGDDDFVRIESDNPAFGALLSVISSAHWVMELEESEGGTEDTQAIGRCAECGCEALLACIGCRHKIEEALGMGPRALPRTEEE